MPHGVVKTKDDAKKWNLAESIVKKQYGLSTEDKDFYPLTMGIFKKMKKKKKTKKSAASILRDCANKMITYK